MNKKLNLILLVSLLSFINYGELLAQRAVLAPTFIDNLGDERSEICAFAANSSSPANNSFTVITTLRPGDALPSDNEFILELSDADGNFDTPTELGKVTDKNDASLSDVELRFDNVEIPSDASSDTYRIRVITSSSPASPADISDPIPIHFYRNDLRLLSNNTTSGLLVICDVVNFVETLSFSVRDELGNEIDPAGFTYQWFKGGFTDRVLVPGETGPTLNITQNDLEPDGTARYFAAIDFGQCTFQYTSQTNVITVNRINTGDINIIGSPTVNFCPQDPNKTLRTNIVDVLNPQLIVRAAFQWQKDDVDIDGATGPTYTLPDNNFDGNYKVEIDLGASCPLPVNPIRVINDGSTITTPLLENLIILPAQTLNLEVTTDAPVSPATSLFQWFRDTSPLTGILSLTDPTVSVDVMNPGRYSIDIMADDSCLSMLNSTTNVFSPVSIGLIIGPTEDFNCDDSSVILEIKDLFGLTLAGSGAPPQVSLTEDQYDFFDFEWVKDGVPTGVTERTLEISTADENAEYTLRAMFNAGAVGLNTESPPLTIAPIPSGIEITASPTSLPAGGSVTLSVQQNPAYTYEWFRIIDGVDEPLVGLNGNTITVTAEGEYKVMISSGICTDEDSIVIGNPPGVSELIPNLITPGGNSANNNWILPATYNESDVEVSIYSTRGELDFQKSGGYNEEWPANSATGASESLYFYIITKSNSVVRKGTITVMR
ncbi:gliding motility-associated C-terminal domain-containing protein [Aquimarina aggregata]|uniref:T9SS type B sorting domain-containing protein n=1 Tax=Aquimarina aggregata TaxID=1642818 RepID=UPI0024910A7D|nr:gliding motility-associated C-terminal domain-containing protein [Aquimarina aggregata]